MTMPSADPLDLYDHEVDIIQKIWDKLRGKYQKEYHNYGAFEREAKDRFADAGFIVEISWWTYEIDGIQQEGLMPELTCTGRTDPKFPWDPDRQVHEVTSNILDIPGEEGVIKADPAGTFRDFRREAGHIHGGGHSHSHDHPHPHSH